MSRVPSPALGPVLVTAFGAFADVSENPSEALLERLREHLGSDRLRGEVLPVEYASGTRIVELITECEPRLVLALGVARRARTARLERVARNLDDCETPDNRGVVRCGEAIVRGGPERLPSTLALEALQSRAEAAGLETEYSDDAGGFLCNHVFYRARAATEAPCGFLHLPNGPLDERWVDVLADVLGDGLDR